MDTSWFRLSEVQLELYKKLHRLICEWQPAWYKSYSGIYSDDLVAFIALLCALSIFPSFERYLKNRSNHFEIHLELKNIAYLQNFVTTIRELGMRVDDIESNTAYQNSGLSVYSITISIDSKELKKYKTHKEIIEALRSLDYIYHIEEMR